MYKCWKFLKFIMQVIFEINLCYFYKQFSEKICKTKYKFITHTNVQCMLLFTSLTDFCFFRIPYLFILNQFFWKKGLEAREMEKDLRVQHRQSHKTHPTHRVLEILQIWSLQPSLVSLNDSRHTAFLEISSRNKTNTMYGFIYFFKPVYF